MTHRIKPIISWEEWLNAWQDVRSESAAIGLLHDIFSVSRDISSIQTVFPTACNKLLEVADEASGYSIPVRKKATAIVFKKLVDSKKGFKRPEIINALIDFLRVDENGELPNRNMFDSYGPTEMPRRLRKEIKGALSSFLIEQVCIDGAINEVVSSEKRLSALEASLRIFPEESSKVLKRAFIFRNRKMRLEKITLLNDEILETIWRCHNTTYEDAHDAFLGGDPVAETYVVLQTAKSLMDDKVDASIEALFNSPE